MSNMIDFYKNIRLRKCVHCGSIEMEDVGLLNTDVFYICRLCNNSFIIDVNNRIVEISLEFMIKYCYIDVGNEIVKKCIKIQEIKKV